MVHVPYVCEVSGATLAEEARRRICVKKGRLDARRQVRWSGVRIRLHSRRMQVDAPDISRREISTRARPRTVVVVCDALRAARGEAHDPHPPCATRARSPSFCMAPMAPLALLSTALGLSMPLRQTAAPHCARRHVLALGSALTLSASPGALLAASVTGQVDKSVTGQERDETEGGQERDGTRAGQERDGTGAGRDRGWTGA